MKVVILAGGKGTRLYEETVSKPKPLIEIGGKPILWHIIKYYSTYGLKDFIICVGYRGDLIKEYFIKEFQNNNLKMKKGICSLSVTDGDKLLNIDIVDTGINTQTGGRLKQIKNLIDSTFCFTYGDTLSNVNINQLILFHRKNKSLATVTACHPPNKYGILKIKGNQVKEFKEKPPMKDVWVNGGYFVMEPDIFEYIIENDCAWESKPMIKLAQDGKMGAFKHEGFYQPMDTMKDKIVLEKIWKSGHIPWKKD